MSPLFPLAMAVVSPFVYGFMNVLDKFVVSKKVESPFGFTIVAGLVNLIIGIILACIIDWQGIILTDCIMPVIAGSIFGAQFFLYYHILSREDVSSVIGFVYAYPIIVAILSYLFINESLSAISYLGMLITISGVLMLSIRTYKIKLKVALWTILVLTLNVAVYEFLIKVATIRIPAINGIAATIIAIGLTIMLGLFHTPTRTGFTKELRNIKWAFFSEILTFLGIATTYFAMAGLSASVVSSLAATQPLTVLLTERFFKRLDITRDTNFKGKILPIAIIVLGVIVIYSQEIRLG